MREETDEFSLLLRQWSQIIAGLTRHNAPEHVVKGFNIACSSTATVEEKAKLLGPLADYLLERGKLLSGRKKPSVRFEGGLPNSLIGAATMEIIKLLGGRLDLLPVMQPLLTEMLEVKDYHARESRQPEARDAALYILALSPDTGPNRIAKDTGVNRSTIGRWLKDEEFISELDAMKTFCADPKLRDICEKALKYSLLSKEELEFEDGD